MDQGKLCRRSRKGRRRRRRLVIYPNEKPLDIIFKLLLPHRGWMSRIQMSTYSGYPSIYRRFVVHFFGE